MDLVRIRLQMGCIDALLCLNDPPQIHDHCISLKEGNVQLINGLSIRKEMEGRVQMRTRVAVQANLLRVESILFVSCFITDDGRLICGPAGAVVIYRLRKVIEFFELCHCKLPRFEMPVLFGFAIIQSNLMGKLWGLPLKTTTGIEMMLGIFHHFNSVYSE